MLRPASRAGTGRRTAEAVGAAGTPAGGAPRRRSSRRGLGCARPLPLPARAGGPGAGPTRTDPARNDPARACVSAIQYQLCERLSNISWAVGSGSPDSKDHNQHSFPAKLPASRCPCPSPLSLYLAVARAPVKEIAALHQIGNQMEKIEWIWRLWRSDFGFCVVKRHKFAPKCAIRNERRPCL